MGPLSAARQQRLGQRYFSKTCRAARPCSVDSVTGSSHPARASLPQFRWSPSAPDAARILGLFVRPDHRRKGLALALYSRLFETLRAAGAATVEEYMGEDYPQYAGKSPQPAAGSSL